MIGLPFREVWAVDFEFIADSGDRPIPICLVARELRSGRLVRQWCTEFGHRPPYPTDDSALFVAYLASAELGCHLELGWPIPQRILDLCVEFRRVSNGHPVPCGRRLPGALTAYGLDGIAAEDKDVMIARILRGGPYSDGERRAILDYCQSDVDGLAALLPRMLPEILRQPCGLGQAMLRGRYMAAIARMEWAGVPVDIWTLERLKTHWTTIKSHLVAEVDRDYGVYEGQVFKASKFADYLSRSGIAWPRLDSGRLALDQDTFRERAKSHPEVAPLYELRHTLGQMRLHDLAVGGDGRNRCLLSPFSAKTGRNQPSNTRYIFGPSAWLRSLIKPDPDRVLAYIDWSAQEVGIAAALSGDSALIAAYQSGDVYMAFAIQAGLAPSGATKDTHGSIRDVCKTVVLGVGYGMEAASMAGRIGCSEIEARNLLELHRRTYPTFWRWSGAAVDYAMLRGHLGTVFGWQVHVTGENVNHRSLRNFPAQGNGSEMLRLAVCLATERGVTVVAPVHDAVLIEAPRMQIDEAVATMRAAMAEASRVVLGGFELGTEANLIRWPDRYVDKRGLVMWRRVTRLLGRIEEEQPTGLAA